MELRHGLHLAYCTNVHRGESWAEVFRNLATHVMAVRERVWPDRPYAVGLRLGAAAAVELAKPAALQAFKRWLEARAAYIFTINGFPYGAFHGQRVKEDVYAPDWTTPDRLDYTLRLFGILEELLPRGVEGSVSTVPVSFKGYGRTEEEITLAVENLWRCVDALAAIRDRTGRLLHLDLEPEPLCVLETSEETVRFFDRLREHRPRDPRWAEHLRVNYDACHLAVEFEHPGDVLRRFQAHGVRVGKLHLSSALVVVPTPENRDALAGFADPVYLHQVVARDSDGMLRRCADLPEALNTSDPWWVNKACEWRIHYHIPLHATPATWCGSTQDHLLGLMDLLRADPAFCQHLEMETYTWEVLPPELKQRDVVEQLAAEHLWTLARLRERGLAD